MGRNVIHIERVQHHHIVAPPFLPGIFNKRTPVFDKQALPQILLIAKETLGDPNDCGIDFDGGVQAS